MKVIEEFDADPNQAQSLVLDPAARQLSPPPAQSHTASR